jgi:hypothetical protein
MEKELSEHLSGFIRKGMNSDDCWNWLGSPNSGGYGTYRFPDGGKRVGAHIAVYEILVGSIPDGMELDHKCRNRSCTNPKHLEAVSKSTNRRRGNRTKLTEVDVRGIKQLIQQGIHRVTIASRYKISEASIRDIADGTRWKDVV